MNIISSKNQQIEYEHELLHNKLDGFDPESSQAWIKLTRKYGSKISREELLSLAIIISMHIKIELDRETKRRKKMLIKWFVDNLDQVWPFIEKSVIVKDYNDNPIDNSK